tara:strand:- start:775 stop:1731 length:957 start_codon:yes stop_codon:yes gene_type:complete
MNKRDKIFVAGHKGLVGSSLIKCLKSKGYNNLITVDKKKLDLRNYEKVKKFFKNKKIDYMIMSAARAGGIMANSTYQKDFFFENIEIQNSLLKLTIEKKIKRVIFLGTSCIYPKHAKNPIAEDSLLTGKLEKTNQCYAIAKISGIKLCEALFEDHNKDIICIMPTNVYGMNDNFDSFKGHVIPAMITKFINAKNKKKKIINLLGTGRPIREFIHSDDLAFAIIKLLNTSKSKLKEIFRENLPIINVGSGESINIKNLANNISRLVGFEGKINFDKNFPDGTLKKNLNSSKMRKLGWKPNISLKVGLKKIVNNRINEYK